MPRGKKPVTAVEIEGTDYFLTHDALCWSIYQWVPSEKKGKRQVLVGHYPHLEHALASLFQHVINTGIAPTLKQILEEVVASREMVEKCAKQLRTDFDKLVLKGNNNGLDDSEDD